MYKFACKYFAFKPRFEIIPGDAEEYVKYKIGKALVEKLIKDNVVDISIYNDEAEYPHQITEMNFNIVRKDEIARFVAEVGFIDLPPKKERQPLDYKLADSFDDLKKGK